MSQTRLNSNNISNYGLVKKGANTSFIIFTIIIAINIIIIIINTFMHIHELTYQDRLKSGKWPMEKSYSQEKAKLKQPTVKDGIINTLCT